MLFKNELALMLALNGNRRLPHLEKEIFADIDLVRQYMGALTLYDPSLHRCVTGNLPYVVFCYIRYILQHRWPEAEPLIYDTPYWNYIRTDDK